MLRYPAISKKIIFSASVKKIDCDDTLYVTYKDETDTPGTNVFPIQTKSHLKDSDLNSIGYTH